MLRESISLQVERYNDVVLNSFIVVLNSFIVTLQYRYRAPRVIMTCAKLTHRHL